MKWADFDAVVLITFTVTFTDMPDRTMLFGMEKAIQLMGII
jgi:hypothetical protein